MTNPMEKMGELEPVINYKLVVEDEDNGEIIYTHSAYSMESLEEKFHHIDKAVEDYKEKLKEENEI